MFKTHVFQGVGELLSVKCDQYADNVLTGKKSRVEAEAAFNSILNGQRYFEDLSD